MLNILKLGSHLLFTIRNRGFTIHDSGFVLGHDRGYFGSFTTAAATAIVSKGSVFPHLASRRQTVEVRSTRQGAPIQ